MQIEVLRGQEEWQRAGAYSVRIEGMNRQHHIPLREEFDEHDCEGTRYIVLLDDGYPVATCRFYEPADLRGGDAGVVLGRVVVLPGYRGKGLGRMVVTEAEKWITELGYHEIIIDSRINAVDFYKKLGYKLISKKKKNSGTFECVGMHKLLWCGVLADFGIICIGQEEKTYPDLKDLKFQAFRRNLGKTRSKPFYYDKDYYGFRSAYDLKGIWYLPMFDYKLNLMEYFFEMKEGPDLRVNPKYEDTVRKLLSFYLEKSPEKKIAVLLCIQEKAGDVTHEPVKLKEFMSLLKAGSVRWNELYIITG